MLQKQFTKKCAYCGKMFNTAHYPTQCCSQSCYFKYKLRIENMTKIRKLKAISPHLQAHLKRDQIFYVKTCPVCGKVFDTTYPQQLYCSESCSGRMKVLRNRYDFLSSALPTNDSDYLPPRKFLREKDACVYLSISSSTLHRLIRSGYLNEYKIGNMAFVKVEEMDRLFVIRNEISTVDLLRYSKKYLSIAEIAEKYDLNPSQTRYILKEHKMHHIVSGKMYLYESDEVETLFSYLRPPEDQDPKGDHNWTAADDLAKKFNCNRNFVYHFCSSHNVPSSKCGRNVFYSEKHFAKALKKYNKQ